MNKKTIKVTFLISFISVFIFCLLAVLCFYLYKKVNKQFIAAENEKNYKACLVEQKKADKIALSYIPIINSVTYYSNAKVNIEGEIVGFKDIAKLSVKPDNLEENCVDIAVDYNQKSGKFSIKSDWKPMFLEDKHQQDVVCWHGDKNIEMRFILESYNEDKIAIPIPNCQMQDCKFSFNLNQIYIRRLFESDQWCLGGQIDIGFGSAPTWELTDEELTQIGLTKDKICDRGYRSERPAIENKYREKKCGEYVQKIPTEARNLMKIL